MQESCRQTKNPLIQRAPFCVFGLFSIFNFSFAFISVLNITVVMICSKFVIATTVQKILKFLDCLHRLSHWGIAFEDKWQISKGRFFLHLGTLLVIDGHKFAHRLSFWCDYRPNVQLRCQRPKVRAHADDDIVSSHIIHWRT